MRFLPTVLLLLLSLTLGGLLASHNAPPSQVASVAQTQQPMSPEIEGGAPLVEPSATLAVQAEPKQITSIQTPNPSAADPVQETQSPTEPATPDESVAFPFGLLNQAARGALVNIFCTTGGAGALNPLSGSGVLIDASGIILTNAHVAQYLLLEESGRVDIRCTIRTGEPAVAAWHAEVYYLSPSWMQTHATEITTPQPEGTGEHDFALLRVTEPVQGGALPSSFPALTVDVTTNELDEGVEVLVASYPAGFLGGVETGRRLYPASTRTTLQHLYTFSEARTLDIVDLGGVILAQSGSSGGAVVSKQGRLVGLIATSSLDDETKDRALHAITLEHINRTIAQETTGSLRDYLTQPSYATTFMTETKPALIELLVYALLGDDA